MIKVQNGMMNIAWRYLKAVKIKQCMHVNALYLSMQIQIVTGIYF